MSKQFVGGLIIGTILGAYVMDNYLSKQVAKILINYKYDKRKETDEEES